MPVPLTIFTIFHEYFSTPTLKAEIGGLFSPLSRVDSYYLTISRFRLSDYKLIFTEPRSFSINFQVNIVSLSRKFCVYLHFTPLFTLWREHELRKRQSKFLENINTLQVKNFTLKVLCQLFFLIL